MSREEVEELLGDEAERVNTLYSIINRDGERVPFRMNAAQRVVYDAVYKRGKKRLLVLKARQHGCSTLIGLMALDRLIWGENVTISLCCDTEHNARRMFTNVIRRGLDEVSARVPELFESTTKEHDSVQQLTLKHGKGYVNQMYAGTRVRSSTNQMVHISEMGKVAATNPEMASEIVKGAFPSAGKNGLIIVESTHEGGKNGEFYKLCEEALENKAKGRSDALDWELLFLPWWLEPTYTSESGEVDERLRKYFSDCDMHGVKLRDGQKKWYSREWRVYRERMFQEYPTTIDECWRQSNEGSVYGGEIARLRFSERVGTVNRIDRLGVLVAMDIGMSDSTSYWVVQPEGGGVRVLESYTDSGRQIYEYYERIKKTYGEEVELILPHDAGHRSLTGDTPLAVARRYFKDVHILERTKDIWIGINAGRQILERAYFDAGKCAVGLGALEQYSRRWNATQCGWTDEVVHDKHSHAADAWRYLGEAYCAGIIRGFSTPAGEKKKTRAMSVTNKTGIASW